MNFSTPSKVVDTIRASDQVERIRANNRVKITNQANGFPPLTADQAKKMGIRINVNWSEMAVLFSHARRQYDQAFLGTKNYFKISVPLAPPEKSLEWGIQMTNFLNRIMKRSEYYACMKEYQHSALVAHGIAPTIWEDSEAWRRRFVAIEDFRVPTDTETSFENLSWCAVRRLYTEGELSKKVFGENADRGWAKKEIAKILKEYHNINFENTSYDWINSPEKMAELVKQNAGFYASDAVPTIPLWHFYYMDDSNPARPKIKLCVVPDLGVRGMSDQSRVFLYQSDKAVCRRWEQLINVQFGDLNNKPPNLYHSVRSLGFLLMEPCYWTNLFRCRLLQHGMENFNAWLRIADPDGRARAQKVELFDKGIVPEGVSIVPQTERHTVDGNLVGAILAQLKQLQSEAAQSYTQSADTGTQKEQTAFETRVKVASVNAMMTGLLGRAFRKEVYAYREIARRFCLRNSSDPDVVEFQDECKRAGIPRLWINENLWEIEPEQPMGSGNPIMAQAQADQMMSIRPMLDPTAQQEVLHDYIEAITQDPRKADRLVPLEGQQDVTEGQQFAEFAFGTLMQGVPVRMKRGLSPIEQIETLLGLMAGVVTQMEQNGNMADAREIIGLQNVGQHIQQLIAQLAQDPQQKARVKQYSDALGKMANYVKAFQQRLQEQGQQNGDPAQMEAAAKANGAMMTAKVKAQIAEANAQQKMAHKEQEFIAEQQRRDAETAGNLYRQSLEAAAKPREPKAKPE